MNSPPRLFVRVDAGRCMGVGHFMRCLALAQQWRSQGGSITFISHSLPSVLAERLTDESFSHRPLDAVAGSETDAVATSAMARDGAAGWLVVDGYHFSGRYQELVRQPGYRLLVIDDAARSAPHVADLVLDQNLGAVPNDYEARSSDCRLLLGTRYALLRREFLPACRPPRSGRVKRILLTLGGGDNAEGLRRMAVAVTSAVPSSRVCLVAGEGTDPGERDELGLVPAGVNVVRQPDDMAALMRWADVAVSAAGTTCWELACLGVPTLLVAVAENQLSSARRLAGVGAFLYAGELATITDDALISEVRRLSSDHELQRRLATTARRLVDGKGAERVVSAMLAIGERTFSESGGIS